MPLCFKFRRSLIAYVLRRPGGWCWLLLAFIGLLAPRARSQDWTANPHWILLDREKPSPQAADAKAPGTQLTDASKGLNSATPEAGRTANLGPVGLSLEAYGTLEYTDNVRVEAHGKDGLIGTAGVRFDGKYQITEIQDISLRGEIANRHPFYGPGEKKNLLSMAPDSMLRFNAWVSEIRLTAFVKYRRQLDPVVSPVVNNTAILDQRALTTGLQADLPIDKGNIQASVLHEYRNQRGDDALKLATWSDVGALRFSREISPAHKAFADATYVRSSMSGGPAGRSVLRSWGLGDEWRATTSTSFRLGAGLLNSAYYQSKAKGDESSARTPFVRATLQQQLRDNLGYSLSLTRTQMEGVTTNFFRITELTLVPNWRFTETIGFESSVSYQWLRESGIIAETARRISYTLGFGYNLRADLEARIGYAGTRKISDFAVRNYTQNRIFVTLTYRF